ncbi:MAG: DUF350 domain-containing protein [Candidatus Micrarchaeia archaeon]
MVLSATVTENMTLAVLYTLLGGILGIFLIGIATFIVPKIVDRLTPRINDERELARGNLAVASYVGQITQAVILGISIIIAAAIISGIF